MCPDAASAADWSNRMREQLIKLLEPALQTLGYELWHLEWIGVGSGRVLRIYIDRDEGIDVDDCEKVSREVSAILDVEEPIQGRYNLEVSSPGLDRHLVRPAHFQRFVGQLARLKLALPKNGRRSFRGAIARADDTDMAIITDEGELPLKYEEIESARLVPEIDFGK